MTSNQRLTINWSILWQKQQFIQSFIKFNYIVLFLCIGERLRKMAFQFENFFVRCDNRRNFFFFYDRETTGTASLSILHLLPETPTPCTTRAIACKSHCKIFASTRRNELGQRSIRYAFWATGAGRFTGNSFKYSAFQYLAERFSIPVIRYWLSGQYLPNLCGLGISRKD